MAANPMQKKSRISFILGMIVALLLASVVVAMLYMKISSQNKTIKQYQQSTTKVYVLTQDVESGQVLTSDMFHLADIPVTAVSTDATTDVASTLGAYSLVTDNGESIYMEQNDQGAYYYYTVNYDANGKMKTDQAGNVIKNNIKITEEDKEVDASVLTEGSKVFYYQDNETNNKDKKRYITITSNPVIAKVDMKANTILTTSLLKRSDEVKTDDLRETEYNVISLPVDLITGDYVDIRLVLPNGEDFIVVSKKQVTVPVVNGAYLEDTIQMNMTEDEILLLSCAIVENYQMEGSKLYAIRYTEAGIQEKATLTYFPNDDVRDLIQRDPNALKKAINQIGRRNSINNAVSNGDEGKIRSGVQESNSSTKDARQKYLQSLPAPITY